MSQHPSHVLVLHAVKHVSPDRLQKAVCGLTDGTLTVNLTGQSETEVKGFVVNGDGKQYGVVLTAERAFCSCPDSMFRHGICKHAVALALHVIRTPQAEAEERKPDLRLRKMRSSDELARDRAPRRLPALPYDELPD